LLGILAILILIPLTVSAFPLPACDDTPSVGQNCTFVTPPIFCTANIFNITNMTGDMILNGSLVTHNAELNLFSFNFTLVDAMADYQVTLCDNTFREVFVGGDDVSVPTVVEGQIFFFLVIIVASLAFFLIGLKHEDPVFGFMSGTGFIISGFLMLINPFDFSISAGAAVFGKASFLGLTAFGLGLMVLGVYVLFSTAQLFISRRRGAGINKEKEEEGLF